MATFKAILLSGAIHKKNDGTRNIKIRIYHNRTIQYISTPYFIEEGYLRNDGLVSNLYPDADSLNLELTDIIQKCRTVCIKLGTDRLNRMNCSEVKEQITAAMEPQYEFIDFIVFAEEEIRKTEKVKTAEWYQAAVNVLVWFYGRRRIDVRDITGNRMNELKEKLRESGMSDKPLTSGAISNYLRGIRSLYNKAKKKYNNEDYDIIRIPNDPFGKVKIPQYKRARKSLGIAEINRIKNGSFSTERANMARDVFMIMFYMMGINIKDLYNLKALTRGRAEYERSKTNTEDNVYKFPLSIKIEPELDVLIKRYSDIAFLSYFRRKYCNAYNFMKAVNKGLEQISEELNLGVKITTNWARHSWASIARNRAFVPKADIDFCLGHVNNDYKMADIYIDIDYSIYDKTNRAVIDVLSEKEKKKEIY